MFKKMKSANEYFFELLAEEIPAGMLPHPELRKQLESIYRNDFRIEPEQEHILVGATPRRLYFRLRAIPERQADRTEQVKGPPISIAFGADGAPTAALQGFLRKNQATLDQIERSTDYVLLTKTLQGRRAVEILAERIAPLVESLRWPRSMRWGRGRHSFIRPVHSVVSIYDGAVVPLRIFEIEASDKTSGHRILSPGQLEVRSFDDYVEKLSRAKVVALPEDRELEMRARALALASEVGGQPREDESIWSQWRYLSECPGVVRAEFKHEFLTLPEEVLITVMRVHQKQLPILWSGSLSNAFLAVMDNDSDPDRNVASGNSFVTNARFSDAKFFYESDRKRTLASRLEELTHLQFHEKLGNYGQKSERIEAIVKTICEEVHTEGQFPLAVARLCKTDLVTEMVKEFTELQGVVGGIYGREEGLPEEVWTGIYDHYLPISAEDPLPRGRAGAIVSLADRTDTLAGFFSLGMRPSGSKDPLGLRRLAQGLVQLLLHRGEWAIPIGVDKLIEAGHEVHSAAKNVDSRAALREFIGERVKNLLESPRWGFAYDEIAAAMEAGWESSLPDLVDRIAALSQMRTQSEFLSILDSARRIQNIVGDEEAGDVTPALFEHEAEKRLHELSLVAGQQIRELVRERKYRPALEAFAAMAPELESFFNDVMVMVDDVRVRLNRKALLRDVGRMASQIADVTRIVVDRRELQSAKQ